MLLRDLLVDRIAPLRNLCDRSVTMYCSTLDRFRDFLGHEPTLDDLDDLTAARFIRWRSTTVHDPKRGIISPASLAKDAAHLKTIWTWAAKKRLTKADGTLLEFPDFARPRVPKPRPVAYTVEELALLIAHAKHRKGHVAGKPAAWYWTTKLRAMFETGERIGAIMQLRWGEVDLDRNTLTFLAATRKGHRETITRAISPALSKMLRMQAGAPDELVWPWLKDRKMLSCYGSLRVLCRSAGVRYLPFHSIRKSTASYLKRAGVSAKKQLGHSSEEMAENHYYDERITGVESALDYLPDLDPPARPPLDAPGQLPPDDRPKPR